MATILLTLGLLYFLAHALSLTFSRTRVPDVLVLMLLGIAIGPVLHLIDLQAFGAMGGVLTTIALAFILFESGTSLDLKHVAGSARATVVLTLVTSLVTIAVVAPLGVALGGLPWTTALLLGTILSGTSSAVVIPMVQALKMGSEPGTVLVLESALTDVLCIVLTFALLQAAGDANVAPGKIIGQTLAALVFAAAIGVAGGAVWLRIWNWVRQFPTTTFSSLAWALVLYGVAEDLGFSGAIAVLTFGLTLRNHEALRIGALFKRTEFGGVTEIEQVFYREVVFLLKTFFFVYLGITMAIDNVAGLKVAAALVGFVYAARFVIARSLLPRAYPRRDASIISVMAPKGLAAAVLAGLPLQAGIEGGAAVQSITSAVVLLSIVTTATLVGALQTPGARPLIDRVFAGFSPDGPAATPGN